MPTITLKQVRFSELDQLQDLGKTTFLQAFGKENDPKDMSLYLDEYFSLSHLQKEWENPESQFWFAIYKNEAIGYLKVNWGKAQTEHQVENALEIQRIYVLENFHGKKVGQQLLNKAFEITRKNQLKTIWLGVWAKNAIALRFYGKNGFKVFDEHQFLFGNDLQTDLMMKLELEDINIRRLQVADASTYRALKLWGLQESPFAFSDSYQDENQKSDADFQREFDLFMNHPERFMLGAFDAADQLKGYVIFKRDGRSNSRHKSMIHNMYIHPDIRGRGIGKLLMEQVLAAARKMDGLEQIHLWVLHADSSASDFYKKLGFISQGPKVLKDQKIHGRYVDAAYMVHYINDK